MQLADEVVAISPVQSYLTCGTPRTSSTLLCRLLAATGVKPESCFWLPNETSYAESWGRHRCQPVGRRGGVRPLPVRRVDLAQTTEGQWRVVEPGAGQVSERPTSLPAEDLLRHLGPVES
ncbi:MAG: Stf0 family sulfotransferase [Acidimicrobiales bacterium]